MWPNRQPHQFCYNSCLHLSENGAGFTGTAHSGCQGSGAPRNLGPIQTNPTHPDCVPPLWHTRSGREGASSWAGRPCLRSSRPEPGIPLLSPSAVRGWRRFVASSTPSVPLQPRETRNQKGKTAQHPELRAREREFLSLAAPPRRRVWGHPPREAGGSGERGGGDAPREGPPRCPNFREPSGLTPRRRPSPAFLHRRDRRVISAGRPRRERRCADRGARTAPPV